MQEICTTAWSCSQSGYSSLQSLQSFPSHTHFYSFFPALEEICASSWSDSSLVGRQLGSRSHRSIRQGRDLKTYENILTKTKRNTFLAQHVQCIYFQLLSTLHASFWKKPLDWSLQIVATNSGAKWWISCYQWVLKEKRICQGDKGDRLLGIDNIPCTYVFIVHFVKKGHVFSWEIRWEYIISFGCFNLVPRISLEKHSHPSTWIKKESTPPKKMNPDFRLERRKRRLKLHPKNPITPLAVVNFAKEFPDLHPSFLPPMARLEKLKLFAGGIFFKKTCVRR